MLRQLACSAVTAALLVPAASRPAAAAWPHLPTVNLPVCTEAVHQIGPVLVPDGAGGAIVLWQDLRNGSDYNVYAQHVLASGVLDPAWPATGVAVCTAVTSQSNLRAVSDGAGGAIACWDDFRNLTYTDIYAQHVLGTGAVDPAWPADGRLLSATVPDASQISPVIVSDGAGGAIVAWRDMRSDVSGDVYAQHVLASGALDGSWPAGGRALCSAPGSQADLSAVSDGAGGAIVAWSDQRGGGDDIYVQRATINGGAVWFLDGLAVCVAVNNQAHARLAPDGAGGVLVTWSDNRTFGSDIYAHHVLASGSLDPWWPGAGLAVCSATNLQYEPVIAADGAGGAHVAWYDFRSGSNNDIYAHHFTGTGVLDPGIPVDGRALCTAVGNQYFPRIVSDGAGGAIVGWVDNRVTSDIYARHLLASGATDPLWPADGLAISTAPHTQDAVELIPDGVGGAILTWHDYRAGTFDIYAQRVAPFGRLGTPEPEIAGVEDVANDQGGRVKLSWNGSYLDWESPFEVDHYWIFRSAATSPGAGPARALRPGERAPLRGERVRLPGVLAAGPYWEFLEEKPALHVIQNYSMLAATAGDSVGDYNPPTSFMVMALDAPNARFWASAAASGYSVDNLAPATPAPFTGNYSGGATRLHWNPNRESDLAGYRLYRGGSAGFVPGPGNRVATPSDTGYADPGPAGGYYKLSAVDTHGNESGFALLTPANTSNVPGGSPATGLAMWLAGPNPAGGATALRFALPSAGRAELAIYDAGGRRVRTLLHGDRPAGVEEARWDGRDDAGHRLASGLYFARLEAAGGVAVVRIARIP